MSMADVQHELDIFRACLHAHEQDTLYAYRDEIRQLANGYVSDPEAAMQLLKLLVQIADQRLREYELQRKLEVHK